MSLLAEIQDAAVNNTADLGSVLRKCKLLAARLGSTPLEEWLIHESNGYPNDVAVPDYRIWALQLTGNFDGPFGSGLRNYPIPLAVIPKQYRSSYESYQFRQSISVIESMLGNTRVGVTTGDLSLAFGTHVYQGYNCVSVTAEFSVTNLTELINTVRNRILDFTIALWKENPLAGDPKEDTKQALPASHVTQIFRTVVHGGTANVVGSAIKSTIGVSVLPHDLTSLRMRLSELQVPKEDVDDLENALAKDELVKPNEIGDKTDFWIGKMLRKGLEGAWVAGATEGGKLLIDALGKYHGH